MERIVDLFDAPTYNRVVDFIAKTISDMKNSSDRVNVWAAFAKGLENDPRFRARDFANKCGVIRKPEDDIIGY